MIAYVYISMVKWKCICIIVLHLLARHGGAQPGLSIPDHHVLQYFICLNGIDTRYRWISDKEYEALKEELLRTNSKIEVKELRYAITVNRNKTSRQQYPFSYTHSTLGMYTGYHDVIQDIFVYTTSIALLSVGQGEARVKYLRYRRSQPSFPTDSIGTPLPANFKLADIRGISTNYYPLPELACQLTSNMQSEREKVRSIFRWITSHIIYDDTGLANHTYTRDPIEVLERRKTICGGYAALFQALCSQTGIKSYIISGHARVGDSWRNLHDWNAVKIDGKWYLLDVTWDRGDDRYFLTPPETFIKDHFPIDSRWTLLTKPPGSRDVLNF